MADKKIKRTPKIRRVSVKPSFLKECAIHKRPMKYYAAETKWRCVESGCDYILYPDVVSDNRLPVKSEGSMRLLVTQDDLGDTVYFLMSENNVMIPVDFGDIEFKKKGQPTVTFQTVGVVRVE